jgi:cell division protein FtsI (penicillin-binding protein 3)
VILDSAVGLHQGGQVSAPVFQRVAQQVLEYLHTPHDVELPKSRQLLLASGQTKAQELTEGSPDHLGEPLDMADAPTSSPAGKTPAGMKPEPSAGAVVAAAMRHRETVAPSAPPNEHPAEGNVQPGGETVAEQPPSSGTVVLDVEQGGIVVPSFSGKSVRGAIELAQDSGLDLDAVGSGLAREQSPAAGSHVASGARVKVTFGR